ncbi:lipid-A-disaccharide synthase [Wenxinia marina]|uniref:Lipid-A-disaccharide synthase n=1 Tax=Wenxinia marina DSM 24838 TaxID=1123501 RepID=A0A0D0NHD7_9RHOB|nr:lipid-A-disaccharide synthase [Wenxinia marina]KIQ67715.1 lipid-A-disaccharide synthase [Wenxinia marina DSM 24838]GGL77726.1 lipid-A-disaccharide synthase [Wenxinia marina]
MKVFVIAGEPSGDRLGAAAMAGLQALAPGVRFHGVGGPEMEKRGLESLFPMSDLSVMGVAEVLPRLPLLFQRIDQAVRAVLDERPDVLLTIDAPDFCLRVAKRVKAAQPDLRTVHYVAPTVWAWRPGRAAKMARHIDHVLALFPFEPPLMQAAGMDSDFVGHPVVSDPQATEEEAAALRAELGLGEAPLVLALPGSRAGEVSRLAPRFGAALAEAARAHPGLRVVLPVAAPVEGLVRAAVADWTPAPVLILPQDDPDGARKRAAFRAADVALAASGTVALELAAAGTPMAIGWDTSRLSRFILRRLVTSRRACLVNIVDDSDTVPELIGEACTAPALARALLDVLTDPGPQRAAMARTMTALGQGGEPPGRRAAKAILRGLGT